MVPTTAVALAALTSAAAGAAPPPNIVPCDSVVLRPKYLDGSHRFVLGRVAFHRTRVFQTAEGRGGSLPYWSKALVFIRAGRMPVTISVPTNWRERAAITWGNLTVTHTLRFAPCLTPPNLSPNRWNGYAGGFYVLEPACVPLRVRIGERSAAVRFGIGRAC
jgi:hypothetical protein